MKKIFSALVLLILSACSLTAGDFSGNLLKEDVQLAQLDEKKSLYTLHFSEGISFVSFPLISDSDADKVLKNANLNRVWQNQDVDSIDAKNSYFVDFSEATSISWEKGEEEVYNSVLLDTGLNYPALYKGEDELYLGQVLVNGMMIDEAADTGVLKSFFIQTSAGDVDAIKNFDSNLLIDLGVGVEIEVSSFAKLAWPLSEDMQKVYDKEQAAIERAKEKNISKQEKQQEKYQKQIEKRLEKMSDELSDALFEEVEALPVEFAKILKAENTRAFESFTASRQTLAQVHSFSFLQEHVEALDGDYWFANDYMQRKFALLSKKGFEDWNTVNRAVLFLQMPLEESEIDIESGVDSHFQPLGFVRAKDCAWQFDPLQTIYMGGVLDSFKAIYDEKHLLTLLESVDWAMEETEDFSNARLACKPEVKSFIDTKKGKFVDIDGSSEDKKEVKVLKDHENRCEDFGQSLRALHPKELEALVYNSDDEPKVSASFPQISFHEDVCVTYWPSLLVRDDLELLVNQESEDEEAQEFFDAWLDSTFALFLGYNKYFSCTKFDDGNQKDLCYLGAAIEKESSSQCKKISSDGTRAMCASFLAQEKKSYAQCEKVYGKYDKKKDKDDVEKQVLLRNCQLDELLVSAKTTKDCKVFKKRFLLFFSKSTPTSLECNAFVNKEKKLSSYAPFMDEDTVLSEMGIEEEG